MKKIFTILLCILWITSFVACDGNKDDGDGETDPTISDTTIATDIPTEPSDSDQEHRPGEEIDLPKVDFD